MGSYPHIYLYRRIVQAKMFIDVHYAEKLNLDNISDEAYFSKFHFIRLFKRTYGKTPHQYLTYVRIEKARELLQEGKYVSDVCFEVGFDSISSFTGLFKRVTGSTPSRFRQLRDARQQSISQRPLGFIPGCFAESNGWKQNSNFEEAQPGSLS